MNYKKAAVSVAVILAGFAVVMVVGPYFANRPLYAPKNQTINVLRWLDVYTSTMGDESRKTVETVLGHKPPTKRNYNPALAAQLGNKLNPEVLKSIGGQPNLVDAWGNPFFVYDRAIAVQLGFPKEFILDNKQQLVIWSAGPNGKNEFGNGDDISLDKPSP